MALACLGLWNCAHGSAGAAAAPAAVPGALQAVASDMHAGPPTSASSYLEQALVALQNERPQEAALALRDALATGELNEAGRTLAYWYIYVAAQAHGDINEARNALADFVVVGEEMMQLRHDVHFAERAGNDFVERFDLEGRLARGRASLSLAWASRTPRFGRSPEQAVPVQSTQEMAFFLEQAPPCAHHLDRRTQQEKLEGAFPNVTRVKLHCGKESQPVQYFFRTLNPQESRRQ